MIMMQNPSMNSLLEYIETPSSYESVKYIESIRHSLSKLEIKQEILTESIKETFNVVNSIVNNNKSSIKFLLLTSYIKDITTISDEFHSVLHSAICFLPPNQVQYIIRICLLILEKNPKIFDQEDSKNLFLCFYINSTQQKACKSDAKALDLAFKSIKDGEFSQLDLFSKVPFHKNVKFDIPEEYFWQDIFPNISKFLIRSDPKQVKILLNILAYVIVNRNIYLSIKSHKDEFIQPLFGLLKNSDPMLRSDALTFFKKINSCQIHDTDTIQVYHELVLSLGKMITSNQIIRSDSSIKSDSIKCLKMMIIAQRNSEFNERIKNLVLNIIFDYLNIPNEEIHLMEILGLIDYLHIDNLNEKQLSFLKTTLKENKLSLKLAGCLFSKLTPINEDTAKTNSKAIVDIILNDHLKTLKSVSLAKLEERIHIAIVLASFSLAIVPSVKEKKEFTEKIINVFELKSSEPFWLKSNHLTNAPDHFWSSLMLFTDSLYRLGFESVVNKKILSTLCLVPVSCHIHATKTLSRLFEKDININFYQSLLANVSPEIKSVLHNDKLVIFNDPTNLERLKTKFESFLLGSKKVLVRKDENITKQTQVKNHLFWMLNASNELLDFPNFISSQKFLLDFKLAESDLPILQDFLQSIVLSNFSSAISRSEMQFIHYAMNLMPREIGKSLLMETFDSLTKEQISSVKLEEIKIMLTKEGYLSDQKFLEKYQKFSSDWLIPDPMVTVSDHLVKRCFDTNEDLLKNQILAFVKDQITKDQLNKLEAKLQSESDLRKKLSSIEVDVIKNIEIINSFFLRYEFSQKSRKILISSLKKKHLDALHQLIKGYLTSPHGLVLFFDFGKNLLDFFLDDLESVKNAYIWTIILMSPPNRVISKEFDASKVSKKTKDYNSSIIQLASKGISDSLGLFINSSQRILSLVDHISDDIANFSLWIILNFNYTFPQLNSYLKSSGFFMKSILSPEICQEKEDYLAKIKLLRHQFETKGIINDNDLSGQSGKNEIVDFITIQRLFTLIQGLISKTSKILIQDKFSQLLPYIPVEEIFSLSLNLIEMCYEKISLIESEEMMERDLTIEDEEKTDSLVKEDKSDLIQISEDAVDIINNLTDVISCQMKNENTVLIKDILPALLNGLISDSSVVRNVTLKILVSMSNTIGQTFNLEENSNMKLNTFEEIHNGEVTFKNTEKTESADFKAKKNKNQQKKDAQAKLLSMSCGEYSISGPTYGPDLYTLPSKWPKIPLQTEIQMRLWILRFDSDSSISSLADELWKILGYQKQVEESCGNNLFKYIGPSKNDALGKLLLNKMELIKRIILVSAYFPDSIQETAQKSVLTLLNQCTPIEVDKILNFIINSYRFLLTRERPIIDGFGRELHPASPDLWKQRMRTIAFFGTLGSIDFSKTSYSVNSEDDSSVLSSKHFKAQGYWLVNMFQFFVPEGLSDRNSHVNSQVLSAAVIACEFYGLDHMEDLLKILENFLTKAPKSSELDKVRQSVIIIIGHLSKHLKQDDARLIDIFKRLISGLNFPSSSVQKAIETCIASVIKNLPQSVVEETIEILFKTLYSNASYAERHGAAHGLAGVIRGLGILSVKNYSIVPRLLEPLEDKSGNAKHRESALISIEKLTLSLGRLFEPYIIKIIEILLKTFGNSQENVRLAAEKCGRGIMSKLSAHGVKLILPSLLKALDDNSSWRIKAESARLIAMLSSCGPKQLSSSLPQIIPRLLVLMSDSQGLVKDAGREALEEISRVIRNPDIKALLPLILSSLKDPIADKGPILKSLSDTCFVHVIDSASLAIIMPIIKRSFEDRSTEIKKDAAKIFGNFFSLAKKEDLNPYIEEVIPYLKTCLLDPVPEVRSVISRALGSMVRGIGESSFNTLMPWLMSTLTSDESPVNRSGAAQGLSEVLGGIGISRLHKIMPDILKTVNSKDVAPHVKDGCVMLFVYLPVVFKDEFSVFIQDIIPSILKCLADETEFLRQTALKAGQKIVNLFAEKSVNILLPQLENGLFDSNWRIRHSSIQLLGDLLYKIGGTHIQEELNDNLTIEKRILNSLGQECRDEIFSKLQVLRSDPIISVRQSAIHVWKIVVNNTVQMLKQIMPTLIRIILNNLSSENADLNAISARSLGDILKIGERVLTDILPMMNASLKTDNPNRRKAVATSLYEVLKNIPKDQITAFSSQFIEPIKITLLDLDSSEVRCLGAKSLTTLMHSIGINMTDEIFCELLDKLLLPDYESIVMDSLKHILTFNSRATLPYILPKLIKPSLNAKAFASLSIVSGKSLGKYVDKILPSLVETIYKSLNEQNSEELEHCAIILTSIEDISGVRFIMNDLCTALVSTTLSSSSTLKCFNPQMATIPALTVGNLEFRLCCLMLLSIYLDKTKDLSSDYPDIDLKKKPKPSKVSKASDESDYESDEDDDEDSEEDDDDESYSDDDDDEDISFAQNAGDDFYDDDDEDNDNSLDDDEDDGEDLASSIYQVLSEIYPTLICNLCRLFSYQDEKILQYTWTGLEAIFHRLKTSKITSQINDIRQGIRTAVSMTKPVVCLNENPLSCKSGEILLPGFTLQNSGHQKLLVLYCDCLLDSDSNIKESASLALTETIQVSSPDVLKKSVLKIIGPMIRILGERESDAIRAAIINSLTLLIEKTRDSVKMFNTQLHAIFIKALGDENRSLRLLSAKGLASIAPYTNKFGTIVLDIISNFMKKFENPNTPNLPSYTKYPASSLHALRLLMENCHLYDKLKITDEESEKIYENSFQLVERFLSHYPSKTCNPKAMNMDIQQNFILTSLPSQIPIPFNIGASHLAFLSLSDSQTDTSQINEDEEMIGPILAAVFANSIIHNLKSGENKSVADIIKKIFSIQIQDDLSGLFIQLNALIVLFKWYGREFFLLFDESSGKNLEKIFSCIKMSLSNDQVVLHQTGNRLISVINYCLLTFTNEKKEDFEKKSQMKIVDIITNLMSYWKNQSKSDKNNIRYNLMCSVSNFSYNLRLTQKAFSLFDHSMSNQIWTINEIESILNQIIIPIVDYLLLGVRDKASQIRTVSEFGIAYLFRLCLAGSQGDNSVQAKVMPLLPTSHKNSIENYLNMKKGQVDQLWTSTSYFPNGTVNSLLEYDFTLLK